MATTTPAGPAYWTELRNDLSEKIHTILKEEHQPIRQAQKVIQIVQDARTQMRRSIQQTNFTNLSEQIHYYKEIEPFFEGRVIFYNRLYHLEIGRPPGDRSTVEAYLQKEWQYIRDFYAEHHFLYRYLRAGETWLDEKLFVFSPSRTSATSDPDLIDPLLHDAPAVVAKLHSVDLMQDYLLRAEEELPQPRDPKQRGIGKLNWTDSKSALIELAYALHSAGSLNDQKADLREIIECLQSAFHIDLGHYPRVFQEILSRKTGYTTYIDRLRDRLQLRIKLIEEKYDPKHRKNFS